VLLVLLGLVIPMRAQAPAASSERLLYEAEWRLIHAGNAEVKWQGTQQADLRLWSTGLVAKLIHIDDKYRALFDTGYCVTSAITNSVEGSRHHEIKASFDAQKKRASYLERDLNKNSVVKQAEIDTPGCVMDVLGGLEALRRRKLEAGQHFTVPLSDGKKFLNARVECQATEVIKTRAGTFQAMRCEAFLFNGEFYSRKGRFFIWVSEDERRLPVQIRVQLPFYIGTVTLTLEKAERS